MCCAVIALTSLAFDQCTWSKNDLMQTELKVICSESQKRYNNKFRPRLAADSGSTENLFLMMNATPTRFEQTSKIQIRDSYTHEQDVWFKPENQRWEPKICFSLFRSFPYDDDADKHGKWKRPTSKWKRKSEKLFSQIHYRENFTLIRKRTKRFCGCRKNFAKVVKIYFYEWTQPEKWRCEVYWPKGFFIIKFQIFSYLSIRFLRLIRYISWKRKMQLVYAEATLESINIWLSMNHWQW